MPPIRQRLWATCAALTIASVSGNSAAAGKCDESGSAVAITSGLGVGVGAAAALISSGVITASDDTRDYSFGIGAGAAIGVTAGLTGLYALVDGTTGCMMAYDSGGYVVWSVPITMFILGALLPIAIWGGADENEPGTEQQALRSPMYQRGPMYQHGASSMPLTAAMTFQF